jgi:uncharacterized protein (DUF2062 family)
MKFRQWPGLLRDYLLRVKRGELDAERFSRSIGIGVLIGLLPVHGFQSAIWLLAAMTLPIEPLLAWLASWVGNAFTAIPLVWLELQLGALLRTGHLASLRFSELRDPQYLGQMGAELLLGTLVFAGMISILSYRLARLWAAKHSSRQNDTAALNDRIETVAPNRLG